MTRTLQPCGTSAAYQRHLAARETACPACKRAEALRTRARRRSGSLVYRPRRPLKTITLRLPHHLVDGLDLHAASRQMSRSHLLEMLLERIVRPINPEDLSA